MPPPQPASVPQRIVQIADILAFSKCAVRAYRAESKAWVGVGARAGQGGGGTGEKQLGSVLDTKGKHRLVKCFSQARDSKGGRASDAAATFPTKMNSHSPFSLSSLSLSKSRYCFCKELHVPGPSPFPNNVAPPCALPPPSPPGTHKIHTTTQRHSLLNITTQHTKTLYILMWYSMHVGHIKHSCYACTVQQQQQQQHSSSALALSAPHDVMACDADTALPNAAKNTQALLLMARPCHRSQGEKNVSHHATASAGQAVNECIHDGVCPSTSTPTKNVPPVFFFFFS